MHQILDLALPAYDELFQDSAFLDWHKQWQKRLKQNKKPMELSLNLMKKNNPLIIPRNHKVEEALAAAVDHENLTPFSNLLNVLSNPFDEISGNESYATQAPISAIPYQTFCGT